MTYYNGTSALKMHPHRVDKSKELEIYRMKQQQLRKVREKERKKKAIRMEVIFSVLLSFAVFAAIVYGYVSPTALRIEVNQLTQELHEIKGLRNDKIAEVETLKANKDIIETAQNVLGMNFASDENYVTIHIDKSAHLKEEEPGFLARTIKKIGGLAFFGIQ